MTFDQYQYYPKAGRMHLPGLFTDDPAAVEAPIPGRAYGLYLGTGGGTTGVPG